jgi:hypothetical protein
VINWPKILKESPIEWLLGETNPSIRYFTLRQILNKDENDSEVIIAKRAIRESLVVKKILQKQKPEGYWEEKASPYLPKYKSSYWTIMLLSQLGTDKTIKRVEEACEHIFQFQSNEGGFYSQTQETLMREYYWRLRKGRKLPSPDEWTSSILHEQQLSCLTGNMAAALIRLGYENDSRVKKAIEWLVKIQNPDGGWLCPYWRAHIRDKHGCFYGTICPLEAFSEIPRELVTAEMRETIEKGAEFLLMHRLFKADHHGYKVINQSWLKLSFPWFYGYNILRGLDVLTKLGFVKDERLMDVVQILMQKRQHDGKWILENTPVGRMQANIEEKSKPSKWITLIALRVLERLDKEAVTIA